MLALVLSLTILINEVMPAPSSGPEWVELYNPSDTAIDVSGWRIDDDTPGGTQTTIGAGSVVPAGGYLVVSLTSAILNNTGDSVTVIDADGGTIDAVAFGALKGTESYGRRSDGAAEWLKSAPSPGASNALLVVTTTETATPSMPTIPPTPTHTPNLPVVTIVGEESDTPQPTAAATAASTATATLESPPSETVPVPTLTPSDTAVPSPTTTASQTQTSSPTKTPSVTRTPSLTKTPSVTRTPSHTKTPSTTRTPSHTKTPSTTRTPSLTRTPSTTRTPSRTKTASRTKTRTKTPAATKTLSRTKTASATRSATQSRVARQTRAANTQIPDMQSATATQPVATRRIAPSPQLAIQNAMPPTKTVQPTMTQHAPTLDPVTESLSQAAPLVPTRPRSFPIMPLASVLLLAGWIGLRVFAKAAAPVLYSGSDEDAESSATDLPSESRRV
jgi:hypothetical protein